MTVAALTRQLGPVAIHARTCDDAIGEILTALYRRRPLQVAFANTHLLYCALQDKAFADHLQRFYVLNDGVGVSLLSRLHCGVGFPENLNGTDFSPRLLSALPAGATVYFIGARPAVVREAAARARQLWPLLNICAARNGYDQLEVGIEEVAWLKPDITFVALGNPLQEQWIARCSPRAGGGVFVGVGAFFDFLAGAAPRAPRLWQAARLEWLYRLLHEPSRLWRRYTVEIAVVFMALWRRRRAQ
ncbi:WecB/TagA/CpsF family glycosyltransferase [Terricaulis sp.]|uniref:WecB/TagA/CpsF family glycosyltransferase n=1 Tax=Terricaulis sp. TaxID=2768686 RepID=UPI0037833CA4